jgi:hypothetical protein
MDRELRGKIIMCSVRTVLGFVVVFGGLWFVRWSGFTYDHLKLILGLVNGYLPEMVLLGGIGAGAFVFYRMDADKRSDFAFSELFKAHSKYDLDRFVRFWLLIVCGWIVFVEAWRDKPLEGVLGIVLGAFLLKAASDSWARAMGKPQEPPAEAGK